MSRQERTGFRDQAYSLWHRDIPLDLDFLDLDWVEFCHQCKRPLAVYELARDVGQEHKTSTVTRNVAAGLGLPGFTVLYRVDVSGSIDAFRIRRITDPITGWRDVAPDAWVRQLLTFRTCHPLMAQAESPPSGATTRAEDFDDDSPLWRDRSGEAA